MRVFGAVAVFVYLMFLPGLTEPFFQIDDAVLLKAPAVQGGPSWSALKTILTPGTQIDFYPVRDLTHWLDWTLNPQLEENAFVARTQNFFWLIGVGIFIALICLQLGVEAQIAWLGAALWLALPLHAETWWWVAARKDVLSLFFIGGATLCFFRFQSASNRRMQIFWGALSLLSFSFSVFSKASFLLIPFALVAILLFLWWREGTSLRKQGPALVLSVLGSLIALAAGLLHLSIYSQTNDMAMDYAWPQRLVSFSTALGREVAGVVWPFVNGIDVENWGEWAKLNQAYFPLGVLAFMGFLAGLLLLARKHPKPALILLALVLATLLVRPGLNSWHRNFYSVRYFEPTLLLALIFALVSISWSKRWAHLLLFGLGFALVAHFFESSFWQSERDIWAKTKNLSPRNPSLQFQALTHEINLSAWGRLSAQEIQKLRVEARALSVSCLPSSKLEVSSLRPPRLLCLSFLQALPEWSSWPALRGVWQPEEIQRAANEVKRITARLRPGAFEKLSAGAVVRRTLVLEGRLDPVSMKEWSAQNPSPPLPFLRLWKRAEECLNQSQDISRKNFLLDTRASRIGAPDVAEFLGQIRDPEQRQKIKSCWSWGVAAQRRR